MKMVVRPQHGVWPFREGRVILSEGEEPFGEVKGNLLVGQLPKHEGRELSEISR